MIWPDQNIFHIIHINYKFKLWIARGCKITVGKRTMLTKMTFYYTRIVSTSYDRCQATVCLKNYKRNTTDALRP